MDTSTKGIQYLKNKLQQRRTRVNVRYKYYEMKQMVEDLKISSPPGLERWFSALGWCGKAVDSLADRLNFRTFEDDIFDLDTIYKMNNSDVLIDSAISNALITSCSFIYITSDPETGYPLMKVIDGEHATGIIDPTTNLLKEGYAVLEYDDNDRPILEAYFLPGQVTVWQSRRPDLARTTGNAAPYPLLVPVINRPDAKRPFGHSRISRACMSLVDGAIRTIKRSEIAAEFYSYPQKYVLGMDESAEGWDKWRATISSLLRIDKDEDGGHPIVGQFQQATMGPHLEQLRLFAGLFAGETGLTMDDMGFPADNPSSSEAIKASHENLRLAAKRTQKHMGTALLNAGYLAACIRDNYSYKRYQLASVTPKWEPIFESDMATLSVIGDGAIKINQALPDYITPEKMRDLTGV